MSNTTTELATGNHAAGLCATMAGRANRGARGFGAGVYPITPQTECIEYLCAQDIEKGHVVRVESEHSAMAVCMGFALGGARTFTASSSNGLAYMAENVFTAGFFRLPIVMMAVNRTLGPPWNIWVDHGDTLALRDAGWVQLYCQDNQEVADATLCAFRLAEDSQVLLPVLVCQDAFVLSHTAMLTEFPTQDAVDRFLPELALPHRVSDKPVVVGGLDFPHETEVHRRHQAEAMDATFDAWERVSDAFEAEFGRRPAAAVQSYRAEDADTLLVCMGTTAATARAAADAARERGERVGVVRVFMFRPFPEVALRAALADAQRIAVIDRDMCPGLGGILWSELRPAAPPEALVQNYLVGLGGGDVREKHLDWILKDVSERSAAGAPQLMEVG